ncbi:hypothetical protein [Tahibacter sp.]|uniref:hypothetical protein n=1 Tax=Tahibacter sp. TaxID=2056211 RepID=UPI0028C47D36|nr:hypothetical protein [Tahibacter sp.]
MNTVLRRVVLLLALLVPAAVLAWTPLSIAPAADECDSLDSVPMRQNVDYNTQIQPIWSTRCANCHVDVEGGNAAADLFLDPPNSWFFLYNEHSSQDDTLIRVVPSQPFQSLLFTKLNCEIVDVGVRMPRQRPPIPVAEQALVHDWILAGALEGTPDGLPQGVEDTIFRARFEIRG